MTKKQRLKHYFDFLWAMTEKEVKARYKHTIFGFLWVVLNPVFQMVVIGFIFSLFIRLPVDNYFLFLFTGLLPWQFFFLSLSKATPSFVFERSLLQKSKFPREVIPLSIIFSNFLHFVVSLIILVAFLFITQNIFFPQILYLVPASLLLLLFTVAVSLLTATLQVRYRDINFFVSSLLALWFYATPIVYNLTLIPANLQVVYFFNPLSYIFELYHLSTIPQPLPSSSLLIANLLIIGIVSVVSWLIYKKEHNFFVDLL